MKKVLNIIYKYSYTFVRWIILSSIIGLLCGLVGVGFRFATDFAHETFDTNHILIFFLPLAGLFINFIYKNLNMKKRDTNTILESLRSYDNIPILMFPLIFISTFITHLYGGSSGKEGAALQMGGSIGSFVGRKLHLKHNEVKVLVMCGMSSLFATFFLTPITASVFSIEVIDVGTMYYGALLPCIISSIVSCSVGRLFGLTGHKFNKVEIPDMTFGVLGKTVLLGVLGAILAVLFCKMMHYTHKALKKYIPNGYLRIVVGALIIMVLTLIINNYRYNGAGTNIIYDAVNGNVLWYDFIFKMIFTVVTLSSGFKGGEILPSFFIGATFGNVFASLVGLNPAFGAALGLISVFSGVVNCPMTALIIGIEFFGAEGIMFFGLCSIIGYMLSGNSGLYDSQKIVFSKLGMEKNKEKVNGEVIEEKKV